MTNNNNNCSTIVSRKRRRMATAVEVITIRLTIFFLALLSCSYSLSTSFGHQCIRCTPCSIAGQEGLFPRINTRLAMSDDWSDSSNDSNTWDSSNDKVETDWENNDVNIWATFETADDENDTADDIGDEDKDNNEEEQDDSELWLDTLAAISAEEIEFNQKENERADKVRQMQEWGFDDETIKNTFDVEVDDSRETKDEVSGMKEYREETYDYEEDEDLDWNLVESHTRVETDSDTGEPVRQQMIYVDEHACIGCYNCANIAQSTFFMEDEHGRARVFEQWGDDDDTISCAIETCPVDCIHYIEYDELVRLETERRGQNINAQARLVNQGSTGWGTTVGATAYTDAPEINGSIGSRCNNCPSKGCKDCPMFGVGQNPEFEKREQLRKEKSERKRIMREREEQSKSVEL